MKMTLLVLFFSASVVFAENSYSQSATMTLHLKDIPVKDVFKEIENMSEFIFIFRDDVVDLNRKVSINVKNKNIIHIMDLLFQSTDNHYEIIDRQVMILKKEINPEAIMSTVTKDVIQQEITITGQIIDVEGVSMPGVNVIIKGTTTGTVSDTDGRYSISVTHKNAILQFSFLGFAPQDIMVGEQKVINVTLMEISKEIEEVVVVAYGTQKKMTVTGSIATVQTKELRQSSAANLTVALAGRLPGLTALQNSGMPGNDEVKLFLRGVGTINGASPLILIDGVPRENFNTLDPNEVASVSILKDASSTAVFGVRGANGVILVTTRQGELGKSQLNVTGEYSLQSLAARFDRVHSWEFAEMRNQAARNDGLSEENLPYTSYMIEKYKDGSDRVFYPDRDIFHDYFHDFVPQARFNLNYSGGMDKIRYFVNAGYINQQGLIRTERQTDLGYDPSYKMNRYNFRANVDYQIFDNLKFSAKIASYLEQRNMPSNFRFWGDSFNDQVAQMMSCIWTVPPTWPGPVTPAGYGVPENMPVINNGQMTSWYSQLNRRGYSLLNTGQLLSTVGLEWGLDFITKGLSTKINVSYDGIYTTKVDGTCQAKDYGFYAARSADETSYFEDNAMALDLTLTFERTSSTRYYMNLQYSLDYARQFGKHNITGLLLMQRDHWESVRNELPYNMLGLSGRAVYNYDQRYIAEFNAGYNGSEQFHKDHRFGFFPSFSGAWVISNENFLKNSSWLTQLKLRASYGKVGNDRLGDERFMYITMVGEVPGPYSELGFNKKILLSKLGNELLKWEIAEKQNYGVDIQLFNSFSLTVDFFSEQRNNVLIARGTVPQIGGYSAGILPKANIGRIQNRGFETEATYLKRLDNGLVYTVKGNFAYNRNKVLYLDEPSLPEDYARRHRSEGYSIGQYFGYRIDKSNGNGYINKPEELAWCKEVYKEMSTPRLGEFMYMDENKDGFIDMKDQIETGYHEVPRINYSVSGNIAWMGFDLSLLFTGIAQSSTTIGTGFVERGIDGYFNDMHRSAWTEERYLNGEKITYPALSLSGTSSGQANDFTILNRSFFRLKNAELGYQLPEKWTKQANISRLRVYVNSMNPWMIWNKYPMKVVDPEQTSTSTIPIMKMYNFGINITF